MTDVESDPLCSSHIHVFEKCAFGFEANPSAATASRATAAPDGSRGAAHAFGKEETAATWEVAFEHPEQIGGGR